MITKIDNVKGLALIREYGLSDFPDVEIDYYSVDGGIIAVKRCDFGGHELHIAFKDVTKVRSQCAELCDLIGGIFWAKIRSDKRSVINCSKKIGFKFVSSIKATPTGDDIEREYNILRRG